MEEKLEAILGKIPTTKWNYLIVGMYKREWTAENSRLTYLPQVIFPPATAGVSVLAGGIIGVIQ